MTIRMTELVVDQAIAVLVMMAAGVFVESLWQAKGLLQRRSGGRLLLWMEELAFWAASAAALSMFLYYCSFGKLTVHGILGFLAGLLLWKKICCGIISAWENNDEADNSKAAAKSSTWRKPGSSGKPSVKRRRPKRKRRKNGHHPRTREAKWPSEGAGTDGG